MSELYCTVTNTTQITNVNVTSNHDAAVATAMIECLSTGLTLGDSVTVDLGYSDNHEQVFTGYVKSVERKTTSQGDTYSITAYDTLVRAQDFFIAASDPMNPYKNKGVSAEGLVGDLFAMAGLTDYSYDATYFTFGINNEFEINLVGVYDYVRTICDLLTWTIYSDDTGRVYFKNRKPYVMLDQYPENTQPGWSEDTATGYTITLANAITLSYTKSERSLRNRVVVYGTENIHAEASASSAYLPAGFYKSSVLAMPGLIDDQGTAQDIADYNLNLLNRVVETIQAGVLGDPSLDPRTVITVNIPSMSYLNGNWYLFSVDHQWSSGGYTCNLTLRRMLQP